MQFRDRKHAGKVLAGKLEHFRDHPDVIVLALPRGGVPVAFEVAKALHAPLDVLVVRKLGIPGSEEYAMGAIASGGVRVEDGPGRSPPAQPHVRGVARRGLRALGDRLGADARAGRDAGPHEGAAGRAVSRCAVAGQRPDRNGNRWNRASGVFLTIGMIAPQNEGT